MQGRNGDKLSDSRIGYDEGYILNFICVCFVVSYYYYVLYTNLTYGSYSSSIFSI